VLTENIFLFSNSRKTCKKLLDHFLFKIHPMEDYSIKVRDLYRVLPVVGLIHHSAKKATTQTKKVLILTMKLCKLASFAQI
jgi:hypothetical protein